MKRFLLGFAKVAGLLILLLLIVLGCFLGWLKWAGERDWKRVQVELQAKGEKLTFAELVPPAPPDNENFFADPIWMQLADLVPYLEKGKTCWEPRVPKKEQLINQWETPLFESELSRIQVFFPSENLSKSLPRKDAIKRLAISLNKSTGHDRQQIAQLILDLETPALPVITRTTELLQRPTAYFPIRYQDNFTTALPHVLPLLTLGQLLEAKASSELALGQTDAAATDIQALLKLARVVDNEPILICMLVGEAILKLGIEQMDQGIAEHRWNDGELKIFQDQLQSIDLFKNHLLALRGERAGMDEASLIHISEVDGLETETSPIVRFWQYFWQEHQKAFYDEWIQRYIDTISLHRQGGVNASSIPATVTADEQSKGNAEKFQSLTTIVVRLSEGGLRPSIQKFIQLQTQVSQTLIACALERYRIARDSYPASLNALVPAYLTAIPKEPTTGNPMQYRLLEDGKFLLWAPGWNLQTLGGKPGEFSGEGDIVWNQQIQRKTRENATSRK